MFKLKDSDQDVVVVGGGAAGIAAAYTAAKNGHHVTLIERNNILGGMATAAYVGTICGLYLRDNSKKFKFVNHGFEHMFAHELAQRSGTEPMLGQHGLKFLPYNRQVFIDLSESLLRSQNVRIIFDAEVNNVEFQNDRIGNIEYELNGERQTLRAAYYVDTSGYAIFGDYIDGLILDSKEDFQAGAQVFGLNNINVDSEMQLNLHLIKAQQIGMKSGQLSSDKSWVSLIPGSLKEGKAYFKLSIPLKLTGLEQELNEAEHYAKNRIEAYFDFFKNAYGPFRNIQLSMIAPSIGVRTGPRYTGDALLTEKDVLACAKLNHSVARGAWPIEYWKPGEKVDMTYFEEGDYYDIPEGCLKNKKVKNLLFAGRHISATEKAIASARVIGTCMQMGESAGNMILKMM